MYKTTRVQLDNALVEKDVENAYRAEISQRTGAKWTSPHGTDGYTAWGTVRLLLEAKYDKDLKDKMPVCNVLGQLILYLKRFEQDGEEMPNVLLVGDKNECFVLSTGAVRGFLSLDIDWSVAPSKGHPDLTRALVQGFDLLPYVYDVDANLDFKQVINEIETLAAGERHQIRANPTNLGAIFLYWRDRVFADKDLTSTEQVDVFLRCLFQPKDVYLHPGKKGVLVVPGYLNGVIIHAAQFLSFFDHFTQGYRPSLIETFYGMKDRLIEDDSRRRQGSFYTPRIWVDEAHKELDRVLGPDWRKECIVWDPAAGTGNLTRDYHDWGELISSTAERSDVQVMKEQKWGGKHVFQYDFLNPGSESPFFGAKDQDKNVIPASVSKALREAAKAGKRLVWLMNPPYGTANNIETYKSTSKAGIAKTMVNTEMKEAKLGAPAQQLYAQFMFRCNQVVLDFGFEAVTVATFAVPTFMCSGSYRKFRDLWYGDYTYQGGFLFQASHFADVSSRWGISFTVWSEGKTDAGGTLPIRLCDVQDFAVVLKGTKDVYHSDDQQASKWVREAVKGLKGRDAPQMSSGLKVKQQGRGSFVPGALCFFGNNANSLVDSNDLVYMVSSADTRNHGLSVLPANWRQVATLYGARKLVAETWINQKDEYLVPSETVPDYNQWVDDCHTYTLTHRYNQCTAMRDVPYKDKLWRIKNHWFWRSRADVLKSLDTSDTSMLYRDAQAEPLKPLGGTTLSWELTGDPYFAHVLPGLDLSIEAQQVMTLLDALWLKSLPVRESYAAGKPELHLTTWDAGIYQLKHLFRDLFPDEWQELKEAHKVLAEKLRPGVYEFGFLKR